MLLFPFSLPLPNSPYLLPNAEPEPYDVAEHVVSASSKLIAIDKILADVLPKGERVLIFSVSDHRLYNPCCKKLSLSISAMDGVCVVSFMS
jgi:predicted P-loop ATPase/GTPase